MAVPAWFRAAGRVLWLPVKLVAGAVVAIVLLMVVAAAGAAYLLLRFLRIGSKRAARVEPQPATPPAPSGGPGTVIDITAESVAPPVVLPRAPRASRWSMRDADAHASHSLDVVGPREGKLLWTFDTGAEVEGLSPPVETADGNIVSDQWWMKGDGGPKVLVLDQAGALVREIVPAGRNVRGPVAAADGTIYFSFDQTLEARDSTGRQLWRQPLERIPDTIRLSPAGELWLFIGERAFFCYSTEGKFIRKAAVQGNTWRTGYFAFDAASQLYAAESDTWRGDPDDSAERFSRVSGFSPNGFLRFGHTLTSPDATDEPYNDVHHVWGLAGAAVFFGHERIQCYDSAGKSQWEIAKVHELAGSVRQFPEFSLALSTDPRLEGGPFVVNVAGGWLEKKECANDRDGNAYFVVPHHVVSVDAERRLRWSVRVPSEYLYHPTLTTRGLLLVTGNGNLYAIGAAT